VKRSIRIAAGLHVRRTGDRVVLSQGGHVASAVRLGRSSTGPVWDALAAPLLLLPPAKRRRVLILGLAAGSVAHVVRRLAPKVEIVGVELDPQVVRAARRFFGLDRLGVRTLVEDARHFLERRTGRFDLVIEDMFLGSRDTLRKPAWLLGSGLRLAARHLPPQGLLVANVIGGFAAYERATARILPRVYSIRLRGYENRIVLAGRRLPGPGAIRSALAAHPVIAPLVPRLALRRVPPPERRRGRRRRAQPP
jgi:spermidine synthase